MRLVLTTLIGLLTFGLGAAWGTTQALQYQPVPPKVLSGNDVGFRVEALRGATAVGRMMVRVNEKWFEAEMSPALKPATD